jgi:hypothetical protein
VVATYLSVNPFPTTAGPSLAHLANARLHPSGPTSATSLLPRLATGACTGGDDSDIDDEQ